ncbi:hypothetical protein BGZ57DRAFT_927077 [Hyaloscypha finlandica]|nr:hypothetical protein BGZ57DRAFT_927077 [Hyaloscypha finlandica]
MRGGRHMPIADAANINSTGILISSTNLQRLELSEDQSALYFGPGKRWGDANIYLNETQTGFDFRTFDSPSVIFTNPPHGFGSTTKDQFLTSVLNYVLNGSSDPTAAIIPMVRYGVGFDPAFGPRYDAIPFYNGSASTPTIFSDFQGGLLPGIDLTGFPSITMAAFSKALLPAFQSRGESHGVQQRFHVVSHAATGEAMDIVHDTFFDGIIWYNFANKIGFFAGLAWNAITTQLINASNLGIGCPQ